MTPRYPALTAAAAEQRAAEARSAAARKAVEAAQFRVYVGGEHCATIFPGFVAMQNQSLKRDDFAAVVRQLVADGVLSIAELMP